MGGHGGLNILPQKSWNGTVAHVYHSDVIALLLLVRDAPIQCMDNGIDKRWQKMKQLNVKSKLRRTISKLEVIELQGSTFFGSKHVLRWGFQHINGSVTGMHARVHILNSGLIAGQWSHR